MSKNGRRGGGREHPERFEAFQKPMDIFDTYDTWEPSSRTVSPTPTPRQPSPSSKTSPTTSTDDLAGIDIARPLLFEELRKDYCL
mmetsp:Transcript_2162/g.7276  ORF Transcript_2162/g.7276 Transcript_2162/m.7276 type:complete len:85 (+) Transcript_2162:1004-1258(+)